VIAAALTATSRRVSAGITPAPGATARLPSWWSATDWVDGEVRGALEERRDLCQAHHVDPDTVLAVARGMAHFADFRTGRDCRPTNARLVEVLRVSLSTVQRARRVLKSLGLVVELVAGRSVMTRAERLAAWRRGSSHRRIAVTFALCSRRRRGRPRLPVVEDDTPPGTIKDRFLTHLTKSHLQTNTETKRAAPRPAHTKKDPPGRSRQLDPATRRLVEGTRARLQWLSSVSTLRLAPTLHRFARAGWTPRDVNRAVDDCLAARGWRLPRELNQPAAYLATLLREVDPADRPGALDEWITKQERAQRIYERQLVHGTPCAHGVPAGDVPSPLRGIVACPLCRSNAC
jgi:hypothetical protein